MAGPYSKVKAESTLPRNKGKEARGDLALKRVISCMMVLFLLALGPSSALAKLAPGDFADIDGHWAENDITAVSNLGLMSGTGDNGQGYYIFAPGNTVNRAQLASVLQRTLGLDYGKLRLVKQPQASDYYRDVDNQAWYADAVMLCAINQVFDAADKFNPDREVTRIEAARAIYRSVNAKSLSIPMIEIMPSYHDMEGLSQEDTNALVFTSNTGLMKGDGQYWRPDDTITRAELARILCGLIQLIAVPEISNGQEHRLAPGNTVTLMLDGNPTTGYRWTASYNEEMVALVGKDYQTDTRSGNLVGQGGHDYWRFKALKAGTTEIKMTYARPWESVQPLKTFTLKVVVSDS